MVQRHQYFKPLLSVLQALCHPAIESFLAGDAAAGDQDAAAAAAGGSSSSSSKAGKQQAERVLSIAGALRGLQKGANIVKKEITKALEAAPAGNTSRVDKQAGGWLPTAAASSLLHIVSQLCVVMLAHLRGA
jgi:hypothetical protein